MPITPSQLSSILRVKKEFNLITGDITLTDLTNWGGSGVIAPDTAAVLLKLVAPTGVVVYQNAGFDTDDFSSPDFDLSNDTLSGTIPQDVNGNYITGTYTLYIKAEVVDDGDTVTGAATTTSEVCACTAAINITIDVDYATAVLTSTDTTQYGAYSSLTRTHTIYPPPISGLSSQTTNATTNVYSNIVTTTWSVEIESEVTYLKANDTYTTCEIKGSKEVVVEADTLCATLCLIKKFRTDFYAKYGKKCMDDMEKAYNLAMDEFFLAWMATRCGRPQSEIQGYINKIYQITGIDPNCDCGCDAADYPTPVVPTSIINGQDGTDGVTPQFQNTGTWIQVSYDEGNTWVNLVSIASITGATGATGATGGTGQNGVAVLHNDITDETTTTNNWDELKSFTIDADQLEDNGDMLKIRVRYRGNKADITRDVKVELDGDLLAAWQFNGSTEFVELNISVTRTGATAGKTDFNAVTGNPVLIIGGYATTSEYNSAISSISPSGWANALDVKVYARDNGAAAITCELFQIEFYKIKL